MNNDEYLIDQIQGTVFPSVQIGESPAPYVSNLQVVNVEALIGATAFTLAWANVNWDPTMKVDHYAIYYRQADSSSALVGPFIAKQSPARVVIQASTEIPVTFFVQTVLTSGLTSTLETSPTTGALTVSTSIAASALNIGQVIVSGMTLTNNSTTAGNVAWSDCVVYYSGSAYVIAGSHTTGGNRYISWTVGSTTFTEAATFSPGPTVFLIATNSGGTSDIAWNKVAAGGVTGAHMTMPALLNGPNGSLLVDGVTWTNASPTATSIAWSSGTVTYRGTTYNLSSGSSGTNAWVYWALASPTIFQSSATYPTLGLDDFMVGLNNSFGATGAQGYFSQVLELHDAQNERTYFVPDAIVMYNAESNFMGSFARAAADSGGAPASGIIRLADGTGTGSLGSGIRIILTAADGKLRCGTFELDRSTASVNPNFKNFTLGGVINTTTTNSTDSLPIQVNGVARLIPVY